MIGSTPSWRTRTVRERMLRAAADSFATILPSKLVLLSLLHVYSDITALRMTTLQIPQHVVFNETIRMQCNFSLDNELLYSVKWYKDGHEFYRYVPKDEPTVQIFPVAGVNVNVRDSRALFKRRLWLWVETGACRARHAPRANEHRGDKALVIDFQTHHSTERSVVLNNVDLSSSGRYRCEVSAEAPAFQTVSDHADMTVVVLPNEGPLITGGRSRYQVGDVVRLNCTSAPSKPAALLTWFVNGEPADDQYLKGPHITAVDARGLETAVLGLEFRVTSKHFKRGDMKMKCLATIATVYLQSNEESVEGDERILKAPVMESRETRAQSHIRIDLINGCPGEVTLKWKVILLSIGIVFAR